MRSPGEALYRHSMRKLTSKEIREGATRFKRTRGAASLRARRGAVRYAFKPGPYRVIQARITDDTGEVWLGEGPEMRDAYQRVLDALEIAAGKGNAAARLLLGVIEGPPGRRYVRRPGPAQGGLP